MVRSVTKIMLVANVRELVVQIHFLGICFLNMSQSYSISDFPYPFKVSITRAQGNKGVPPNATLLHRTFLRASCRNSRAINREE